MTWEDEHRQRVAGFPEIIRTAHASSSNHRSAVLRSTHCGCFFCCQVFRPDRITEWTDADDSGLGQTALCPHCGIDAVLPEGPDIALSPAFLADMKAHWF